jgi:Rrf2 family iron-sulfur cluster assembly transcriptional regulator
MTHELWASLNRHMVDFLDSVSLQDLVDEQRQKTQGVLEGSVTRHVLFREERDSAPLPKARDPLTSAVVNP